MWSRIFKTHYSELIMKGSCLNITMKDPLLILHLIHRVLAAHTFKSLESFLLATACRVLAVFFRWLRLRSWNFPCKLNNKLSCSTYIILCFLTVCNFAIPVISAFPWSFLGLNCCLVIFSGRKVDLWFDMQNAAMFYCRFF